MADGLLYCEARVDLLNAQVLEDAVLLVGVLLPAFQVLADAALLVGALVPAVQGVVDVVHLVGALVPADAPALVDEALLADDFHAVDVALANVVLDPVAFDQMDLAGSAYRGAVHSVCHPHDVAD